MERNKTMVMVMDTAEAKALIHEQLGYVSTPSQVEHRGGNRGAGGPRQQRSEGRTQCKITGGQYHRYNGRVQKGKVGKRGRTRNNKPGGLPGNTLQECTSAAGSHMNSSAAIHEAVPIYCGHQLIGDSNMSRLAAKHGHHAVFNPALKAKQLGAIVHGQTSNQLLKRLKMCSTNAPQLHEKAILLIGTNDILKKVPLNDIFRGLKEVVKFLEGKMKSLIVLSIPPILKLNSSSHLETVGAINTFLKGVCSEYENVHFLNVNDIFVMANGSLAEDFYEKTFKSGMTDGIHFNACGLDAIEKKLSQLISHVDDINIAD